MSASEDLVRDFCTAWSGRDIDKLVAYFNDDAVYHNIPMEPVQGHAGIRAVLEFFVPNSQNIDFEVLAMASAGDTVFTERVDRFEMNGKKVALPVAGVFEVRDGKIAAWRDYFDMATWTNQTT
jgi:limonene-1,2-epoxide hydrolase